MNELTSMWWGVYLSKAVFLTSFLITNGLLRTFYYLVMLLVMLYMARL